jgi:hypothetical protein
VEHETKYSLESLPILIMEYAADPLTKALELNTDAFRSNKMGLRRTHGRHANSQAITDVEPMRSGASCRHAATQFEG